MAPEIPKDENKLQKLCIPDCFIENIETQLVMGI
jgi:hypothetical protein